MEDQEYITAFEDRQEKIPFGFQSYVFLFYVLQPPLMDSRLHKRWEGKKKNKQE